MKFTTMVKQWTQWILIAVLSLNLFLLILEFRHNRLQTEEWVAQMHRLDTVENYCRNVKEDRQRYQAEDEE